MHLSRILDQIKRHPSPTEALTKLGKAMDKHEDNLLEKGFRILKSELCANVYEAINGPHFDEEHAKYAVEGMENEDGSKGPHWTVEETTSVANQMGINLKSEKHNKWDWYVAMNMIYSDFYKAVVAITGGASTKHFAELTKAWICDKDISEGKMWHYYVYITIIKHMNICLTIVNMIQIINMVEKEDLLVECHILTLDMKQRMNMNILIVMLILKEIEWIEIDVKKI